MEKTEEIVTESISNFSSEFVRGIIVKETITGEEATIVYLFYKLRWLEEKIKQLENNIS